MTVNAWWLLATAWAAMGLAGWIVHVLRWVENRDAGSLEPHEVFKGIGLLVLGVAAGPVLCFNGDDRKDWLKIWLEREKEDSRHLRQDMEKLERRLGEAEKERDALRAAHPALKRKDASHCFACGKPIGKDGAAVA